MVILTLNAFIWPSALMEAHEICGMYTFSYYPKKLHICRVRDKAS